MAEWESVIPRYILRKSRAHAPVSLTDGPAHELTVIRADDRVTVLDELSSMLLVDCPDDVAAEYQGRLTDWKWSKESHAARPDPRPGVRTKTI